MTMITNNFETNIFIQSEAAFSQAKTYGFWDTMTSRLRRQRPHLLPFQEAVQNFQPEQTIARGLQDVPLNAIVGSVSRAGQFTRRFFPASNQAESRERWRSIYTRFVSGRGLPPIEVLKIGNCYFVEDGHHRVSVARYLGWQTIQAHVAEVAATC